VKLKEKKKVKETTNINKMEFKHFYKCQTVVNLLLSRIYDYYMKGEDDSIQCPYVPNYLFLEERLKLYSDNNLNFLNHLISPKMYDYINKPKVLEMLAKCYVELKKVQINKLCEEDDIMDDFLYLFSVIDKTSEVESPPSSVTAVIGRDGSDFQSIWNKMNHINDPYLAIKKEKSSEVSSTKQSSKINQSKKNLSSINNKNTNTTTGSNDADINNDKNKCKMEESNSESDKSLSNVNYVTSNEDISSLLSLNNKVLSRLPSVHVSEEYLNREQAKIKIKNKNLVEEQIQFNKILKKRILKSKVYNKGIREDDDQDEKPNPKKILKKVNIVNKDLPEDDGTYKYINNYNII